VPRWMPACDELLAVLNIETITACALGSALKLSTIFSFVVRGGTFRVGHAQLSH